MNTLHERLNDQNLDHFMVLEGGGPFGIGYEAGLLDEFRHRGAGPKGIHVLGTSAGSWVGAMMATETRFEDVADKKQIKLFNQKQGYMREYARDIFGDARSEYVNATGSRLQLGLPQLEIFNGEEHDLAEMVTMSSSVPLVFAPAAYKDGLYWDGAVAGISAGYAHLAPRAKKLIAISALSTHLKVQLPGPLDRVAGPILDRTVGPILEKKTRFELHRWKKDNPEGEVIYIKPNREISNMVKSGKDIFDFRIAKEVYWMAREQAADLMDNEQEDPKLIKLRQQVMQLLVDLSAPKDLSA